MAVRVSCPSCSATGSVADEAAGQNVACRRCKTSFRVAAPDVSTVSFDPGATVAPCSAAAPPADGSLQAVGRYQVKSKLGAGAFGAVYRAYDPQLDRDVALKLLRPEALSSPSTEERFRREARAAARMLHANVVPVYEYGEHEGAAYIASAFIEGKPLSDVIPEGGIEPRAAAKLAVQLADALAYAHEQGVVHRDVKPDNCLVDGKGRLYLADFGLAGLLEEAATRMTRIGSVMGTPAYMAPEQAMGKTKDVGPLSDQYSAGVALYEMLTGSVPFVGRISVVLHNVVNGQPQKPTALRPGLDPALEAICLKAMAKKPQDRFTDAAAFAQALRGWLARSKTALAGPPSPPPAAKGPADAGPARQTTARGATPTETDERTTVRGVARTQTAGAARSAKTTVLAPAEPSPSEPAPSGRWWLFVAGLLAVLLIVGAATIMALMAVPGRQKVPVAEAPTPSSRDERPKPARPDNEVPPGKEVPPLGEVAPKPTPENKAVSQEGERLFRQGQECVRGTAGEVDEAEALRLFRQAAKKEHAVAAGWVGLLVHQGKGTAADQELGKKLVEEVLRTIRRMAEEKDCEAQYLLGAYAGSGIGMKKDDREAARWFGIAADLGQIDAMVALGVAYANGRGVPKDDEKAVSWYRKAVERGLVDAMYALAVCLAGGVGVGKDEAEAARWYRKAAQRGHLAASCALGLMCAEGRGVKKDEKQAVELLQAAADGGDALAMQNLGAMHGAGRGVGRDDKKAVFWYRRAAELGQTDAMFALGIRLAVGLGVEKDEREALEWYRRAAVKGHVAAAFALGVAYAHGRGVPKDDSEAAEWYRKAADKGHVEATFNLGVLYDEGRGVPQDTREAIRRWRTAADKGDPSATYCLGLAYAEGRCVAKDDKEAIKLWLASAAKGDASAMNALGLAYAGSFGGPKDEKMAAKWFQEGATKGSVKAMYNLAVCYEAGAGVARSRSDALKWYRKAADLGYEPAKIAVNRLLSHVRPETSGAGPIAA